MKKNSDLLIAGAGAIGLSLADAALRAGLSVTVLDAGMPGQQASWAGAGMLTCRPRTRRDANRADYYDLAQWSVRLHAEWSERLKSETGLDVGYRRCGALEVTRPAEVKNDELDAELSDGIVSAESENSDVSGGSAGAVAKDDSAAWIACCVARGIEARWVGGAEARRLEPELSADVQGAIEFPNEAQIRNPWFVRALEQAVRKRGGEIVSRDGAAEFLFDQSGARASGVRTASGRMFGAGSVALCTGAWSGQFSELSVRWPELKKIHPVRGELLCYETGRDLAARLICERSHYFVPRGDGVILVGATHEKAGFDATPQKAGCAELERFAHALLPALAAFQPAKHWAGLRPGMKGRHPILGPLPGVKNLFINAGHYRNGLTLAPACAELLLDEILERPVRLDGSAWLPRETAAGFSSPS